MKKKPFVTKEQLEEIVKKYPTPFHLYDEKGIRENAKAVKEAFAWNPGFREYFAVKATPNPFILDILKEYDCGCDCASLTELMLADSQGFDGKHIMFSSNNPGGVFKMSNGIMDNPGDAKYGFTHEQIIEGFKILKEKGAKHFGVHAFLASNTVTNEYYPKLARELFELVVELRDKTGCDIRFINLSGGVAIHEKHTHKEYIGVDACAVNLMRPAIYGAYHHITVMGKEDAPCDHKYDVTGSLCENCDKFAIDRMLPKIDMGDLLVIHDTGAHGFSMGYNYNGKLKSAEVLLKEDGSTQLIRRAETPEDYFRTFDCFDILKDMKHPK